MVFISHHGSDMSQQSDYVPKRKKRASLSIASGLESRLNRALERKAHRVVRYLNDTCSEHTQHKKDKSTVHVFYRQVHHYAPESLTTVKVFEKRMEEINNLKSIIINYHVATLKITLVVNEYGILNDYQVTFSARKQSRV